MKNIEIHQSIIKTSDGNDAKLAILRASISSEKPIEELDIAVSKYVENNPYNQYIEIYLDNPWTRVIINKINELKFVKFENQKINEQEF